MVDPGWSPHISRFPLQGETYDKILCLNLFLSPIANAIKDTDSFWYDVCWLKYIWLDEMKACHCFYNLVGPYMIYLLRRQGYVIPVESQGLTMTKKVTGFISNLHECIEHKMFVRIVLFTIKKLQVLQYPFKHVSASVNQVPPYLYSQPVFAKLAILPVFSKVKFKCV